MGMPATHVEAGEIVKGRTRGYSETCATSIDTEEYDIDSVWQWTVSARIEGEGFMIKTCQIACTPTSAYPSFLPGEAAARGSCLVERGSGGGNVQVVSTGGGGNVATGSGNRLLSGLGTCLQAIGSQRGANVTSAQCSGINGQKWRMEGKAVKNANGLRLDIEGGNTAVGANLIGWNCHGGVNQQWTYSGGQLRNAAGRCVDIAGSDTSDGANVLVWNCHGREPDLEFPTIDPASGNGRGGVAGRSVPAISPAPVILPIDRKETDMHPLRKAMIVGAALFGFGTGVAGASELHSASGVGCLDVDMGSAIRVPIDKNRSWSPEQGRSRDVIAWPNCHGGKNQQWSWRR